MVSPAPNGSKRRQKPKRRDTSGNSSPDAAHRPRKSPVRNSPASTHSSSTDDSLLSSSTVESERSTALPRRKKRTTRGRSGTDRGSDDDVESPFLVEMDDMSPSADEEELEADEENGLSDSGRNMGPCCCIRGLVDVLKLLASSWLHFALVLLPFPIIIYLADWHKGLLFVLSYLSLFPLSSLMVRLQQTFRGPNAPELDSFPD